MLNQTAFRRKKQGVLEPKTALFELKIVAFFEKENGTFEKKMTYFQKRMAILLAEDPGVSIASPGCNSNHTRV